jgi:hypothetical protein
MQSNLRTMAGAIVIAAAAFSIVGASAHAGGAPCLQPWWFLLFLFPKGLQ